MQAEVVKTFYFEAAHCLSESPLGHKCRRLHGHSYRVDIHVIGQVDPHSGWVIDFGLVKQAIKPVVAELDHRYLNDIPDLANPTSELIAKYLWDRAASILPGLSAVTVWESQTSRCVYRGQ